MIPASANFVAWTRNGADLLKGDKSTREWIRNLYIVPTHGIEQYLGGVRVIVGPRGSGKSVLVAKRAVAAMDSDKGLMPSKRVVPFCHRLPTGKIQIHEDNLGLYLSTYRWAAIWELVFAALACAMATSQRLATLTRQKDGESPKDLINTWVSSVARRNGGVSTGNTSLTITEFLLDMLDWYADQHIEMMNKAIQVIVQSGMSSETLRGWASIYFELINKGDEASIYSIHVDAIDEAIVVSNSIGEPISLKEHRSDTADDVWIASQKGFLVACHWVSDARSNVQVCGSIRSEAGARIDTKDLKLLGATYSKAKDSLYTEISYNKQHLIEIFALNVKHTESAQLANQQHSEPINKLFGFDYIPHSTRYGFEENVLDLIIRHTFGTPRDLVSICADILLAWKGVDAPAARIDALVKALDKAAVSLCLDWLDNVFPVLGSIYHDKLSLLTKNIYAQDDLKKFEETNHLDGFFDQLYSRNLIGIPTLSKTRNEFRFEFRQPDGLSHTIPKDVRYVALHPAFAAYVCDLRRTEAINNSFYSDLVVVGDGYVCPQALPESIIEVDMRSSNWVISTKNDNDISEMDLHNENQFMRGATPANQSAARNFLISVVLTMFKKNLTELRLNDILDEIKNWPRVGISSETNGWLRQPPSSFYSARIFGSSKWELVTEINKSLEKLHLAIRLPEKDKNDSTSLMWKSPGATHHKQWVDIDPRKVRVLVKQDRTILNSRA